MKPKKLNTTKSTIVKNESINQSASSSFKGKRVQSNIQVTLFNYLSDIKNRESVKDTAIKLNGGNQRNSCVYFVSESLRRIEINIPLKVCNTGKINSNDFKSISLAYYLQNSGWKVCKDKSLLLPGDICFTTSTSDGRPTHSYIFMGWVKEGEEDFALVCDNQSYDYGTTLHVRNIKNALNGKEAFCYFMFIN